MAHVTTAKLNDEVLTGEAVALDLQPLGLVARATGAVIDMVVVIIGFVATMMLYMELSQRGLGDERTGQIVIIGSIVLFAIAIPTAIETLTRGRSIGKLVMGGRIVRSDGGTIGFRHAFLRSLVGFVEIFMTLGTMALLVGIFTPRAQRLGDLVAGAYCESVRIPPLPNTMLLLPPALYEWAQVADVSRMPDQLARKMWQFSHDAPAMHAGARQRIAGDLIERAAPFVYPLPAVDPVTAVTGVMVMRRDRELRALDARNRRAASLLTASSPNSPQPPTTHAASV